MVPSVVDLKFDDLIRVEREYHGIFSCVVYIKKSETVTDLTALLLKCNPFIFRTSRSVNRGDAPR